MEPLAFVYRETLNARVIEAGYSLFHDLFDSDRVSPYMLKDLFALMPLLEEQDLLKAYLAPDPGLRREHLSTQTEE